jgi:hypothetical protein
MPTSFLALLPEMPVNSIYLQGKHTISHCRIVFCSVLFVVLIEMCKTRFDPPAMYHTNPEALWKSIFQRLSKTPLSRSEVRQITLGHDPKHQNQKSIRSPVSFNNQHYLKNRYPWAWSQAFKSSWTDTLSRCGKIFKITCWGASRWKTSSSSSVLLRAESSSLWSYWC